MDIQNNDFDELLNSKVDCKVWGRVARCTAPLMWTGVTSGSVLTLPCTMTLVLDYLTSVIISMLIYKMQINTMRLSVWIKCIRSGEYWLKGITQNRSKYIIISISFLSSFSFFKYHGRIQMPKTGKANRHYSIFCLYPLIFSEGAYLILFIIMVWDDDIGCGRH